jgi:hypothetical protein
VESRLSDIIKTRRYTSQTQQREAKQTCEGQSEEYYLVQDAAETPYVCLGVVLLVVDDLWRHLREGKRREERRGEEGK